MLELQVRLPISIFNSIFNFRVKRCFSKVRITSQIASSIGGGRVQFAANYPGSTFQFCTFLSCLLISFDKLHSISPTLSLPKAYFHFQILHLTSAIIINFSILCCSTKIKLAKFSLSLFNLYFHILHKAFAKPFISQTWMIPSTIYLRRSQPS